MRMTTPPNIGSPLFLFESVNRSAAIPCVLLKDKNRDYRRTHTPKPPLPRTLELIMNALNTQTATPNLYAKAKEQYLERDRTRKICKAKQMAFN